MIRSMTGFGTGEVRQGEWAVRVEVRSVNHKDLQVSFRLPEAFRLKEYELQKLVEQRVRRGHLYLSLACSPAGGETSVLIDAHKLRGYVAALRGLAEAEGVPFQVDMASLLRLPGAIVDVTTDEDLREQLWPGVVEATRRAMDDLVEMRRVEGDNLHAHLNEIREAIGGLVDAVAQEQGGLVAAYQERLRERLTRLLEGADVPVKEDVLAREVALYADRSDVTEEIARLRSHLEQFRDALDGDETEPVGRRMEFLGQEMLREASTAAAKIPGSSQIRRVLDLKSQIDKLREQVRNVE
jgi:uncharacterized protein (TIGR00255 family)